MFLHTPIEDFPLITCEYRKCDYDLLDNIPTKTLIARTFAFMRGLAFFNKLCFTDFENFLRFTLSRHLRSYSCIRILSYLQKFAILTSVIDIVLSLIKYI